MVFHPEVFAGGVVPFVGVAAVAVHVAVAGRRAPIGEQHRHLMQGFRGQRQEIPEHVGVFQVGLRMAFLGVDEIRKFQRITDEKDRRVVADQIVVAFLGVELQGEAARVAGGIRRAAFAADRREPGEDLGALARLGEESGPGVAGHVGRDLEIAVGAGPLGVDHALGNAFPVEMRQLFQQVHVLHERRPAWSGGGGVLIVSDRCAKSRGIRFFVGHGASPRPKGLLPPWGGSGLCGYSFAIRGGETWQRESGKRRGRGLPGGAGADGGPGGYAERFRADGPAAGAQGGGGGARRLSGPAWPAGCRRIPRRCGWPDRRIPRSG